MTLIDSASNENEKLELIKKFSKGFLDEVDKKTDQVLDAGIYIYGMTRVQVSSKPEW
jgi:hypothetical protein